MHVLKKCLVVGSQIHEATPCTDGASLVCTSKHCATGDVPKSSANHLTNGVVCVLMEDLITTLVAIFRVELQFRLQIATLA